MLLFKSFAHELFTFVVQQLKLPLEKLNHSLRNHLTCHAGVARCSQAGTQNWTIATQLTYHTEQEHRERTHSGFVV